jgi:hypothetical protein
MSNFMPGKLKEKVNSSVYQAAQGGQAAVDDEHHPGLQQEAEQLHTQEDPEGDSCQGRGHQALKFYLKMCKNM